MTPEEYSNITVHLTDEWGWYAGKTNMKEFRKYTHTPERCQDQDACVIHNPSSHFMLSWDLLWRQDRNIMERQCPHNVGHPDPDDLVFQKSQGAGKYAFDHGCDGCCYYDPELISKLREN